MKSKFTFLTKQEEVPLWKTKIHLYNHQEKVDFMTSTLLFNIVTADKISVRVKRLNDLLDYVERHPKAQTHAIKNNVVSILLIMRRRCKDDKASMDILNQLLPVFGYVDPPNSRGIRILSIDGGGMRGIAAVKMLEEIERLSGKKIHELFDYMCGVSTGAIITCCLLPPHCMPLQSVYELYMTMSTKVFKQSRFWGTSKLLWSHGYYDTAIWEKLLKDYLGEFKLLETNKYSNCPKVAIISTVVNLLKATPYIFRNYQTPVNQFSPYPGGFQHTMFEAVRASAAAPTIFEEFKTGNMLLHQDGGLIVNNPTAVALQEARTLWPNEPISCIVSCGTGRFDPLPRVDPSRTVEVGSSSWTTILKNILESATDTERVHAIMSELHSDKIYFRLNPNLSTNLSMDDTNKERLDQVERDTQMYCRRNSDKLLQIVKTLKSKRSILKTSVDHVRLYNEMSKAP